MRWVERNRSISKHLELPPGALRRLPEVSAFPAVITDWEVASVAPHRYRYSWEMLAPYDKSKLFMSAGATSTDSSTGETTNLPPGNERRVFGLIGTGVGKGYGPAYNMPEWGYGTTDDIPPGFDTSDPEWPTDFNLQPIQKRSMVIIYMVPSHDLDFASDAVGATEDPTNVVPCFCLSNVVMGDC